MDVRPLNVSGKLAAEALEAAGIVVNYNGIPYDPNPPFFPSGVRLGTPGVTSRGMKEAQMKKLVFGLARFFVMLPGLKIR